MKELLISLDSRSGKPLYEQIYTFIKEEIRNGKIPPGERLPSSRALARQLSVSRSTADLAYEQLTSEGYLQSVPCKGYFAGDVTELYQLGGMSRRAEPVQRKECPSYRYDFAISGIDRGGFPLNAWRKISKAVLAEEDSSLFHLGDPQGEWELREAIANYLHHARGVDCGPDQIITGAGNDYLLMLLSVLLGKDKPIAMENPTYKSAYQCFKSLGHPVCAISLDESGMRPDELGQSCAQIAYVMPSHQFPMGTVMPIRRRLQLLAWAAEVDGRFLIEDDYDSEFRYKGKPIPALQGYDKNDRVIYLGTFSKSMAPAIRISYMVLPKRLMAAYEQRGRCFSATVSRVDQKILEIFLREGYFERHLNRMRAAYKNKHDLILKQLRAMQDFVTVEGENAGVHVLVSFINGMNEKEAVEKAAAVGIHVYGLSEYFIEEMEAEESRIVLLGYATMEEEEIISACKGLMNVWGGAAGRQESIT